MLSHSIRPAITAAARNVRLSSCLRHQLSTLAILEHRDGQLNAGSLSAVAAAQKLGGSVHGFVAGGHATAAAQAAAKLEGVEKIISVNNSAYDKVE